MARTILMHGIAPNVPSSSLSIVRRRSRGSLPRLHLSLISSSPRAAPASNIGLEMYINKSDRSCW